eukprot:TRINITY_DN96452_c0_g1_i1.p3 TRINITY_DN96452_c0_g1~~TRINITY_DN96452_c0_g1_i1.p3  ORF type:complete len:109 (+),score=18.44 TRINITY_DN96452_c0_g1_i1:360-686(+)
MKEFGEWVWEVEWGEKGFFKGRFEDKAFALEVFQKHTEDVIATVPPEKLLVFDVKDGWGPLCDFLEVPIPEEPFPRVNDKATFHKVLAGMRQGKTPGEADASWGTKKE